MLKKWFIKELPPQVNEDVTLSDIIWIDKGIDKTHISPSHNGGVCYIKMAVHKDELAKRHNIARKVKPLNWRVTNGTFKTFTANAAGRVYQVFVIDATTFSIVISTRVFSEPPNNKLLGEFIYLHKTDQQTTLGDVLKRVEKVHESFILKELEG